MKNNRIKLLIALLVFLFAGIFAYKFFTQETQSDIPFLGKGGEFRGHGATGEW